MRKLALAFAVLAALAAGPARAAMSTWAPALGLGAAAVQLYGPLTNSANPFTVLQTVTGDPGMSTVGSPASVRVAGDYQLASGTICSAGSGGSSTVVSVNPAPVGQRQWLVGLANTCTLGVVTGTSEPVNAVAEAIYPAPQAVTVQIATGDGATKAFSPAFKMTGTTVSGSNIVQVDATDGVFANNYMAWAPSGPSGTLNGIATKSFATVQDATHLVFSKPNGDPANATASGTLAFYLGNVGLISGPNGGVYPFIPVSAMPGTASVQAGSITGSDSGALDSNGLLNITGTGVTCAIRVLEQTTVDAGAAEHTGYYRCDFTTPPPAGTPITLSYTASWIPGWTGNPPKMQTSYLFDLLRLTPSADDAAGRQVAQAVRQAASTTGIPNLDPSVPFGLPAGKSVAPPCLDMSKACTNLVSDANSNAAAVALACPDYNRSTTAYTWKPQNAAWDSTSGLFATDTTGTATTPAVYCGFDIPGALNAHYHPYQDIRWNRISYSGRNSTSVQGVVLNAGNQTFQYNEVIFDEGKLGPLEFVFGNMCLLLGTNSSTSTTSNFTVKGNYFHDCLSDGIDVGGATDWTISQNVIAPAGSGLGAHADGIQTVGDGSTVQRGVIDRNYISIRAPLMPPYWSSLNAGVRTQHKANFSVYLEKRPGMTLTDVAVTNNFLEGGQRAVSLGVGAESNISFTGNIFGMSQVFTQAGSFQPTVSGNRRYDSGGPYNPF